MKKLDLICYLKMLGALVMIFPFVHVFIALDHGLFVGGLIAGAVVLVLFLIGVLMFNYLEYGKFRFRVK